jgi:hypothetical protein
MKENGRKKACNAPKAIKGDDDDDDDDKLFCNVINENLCKH